MLEDTPLAVLRLYEMTQVAGTLFGAYLVARFGGTKFLAGLYAGCVSIFFWDWIFTDHWFLNLTYDSRSITLFTIADRPEPLWSPCSYATFFGVTTLLLLRYRDALDRRLGRWQYVLLPAFFVVLDVTVEGLTIAGLDIYRYGYRDEWTIFGVPYTNLVWVNIILLVMVGCIAGDRADAARTRSPGRGGSADGGASGRSGWRWRTVVVAGPRAVGDVRDRLRGVPVGVLHRGRRHDIRAGRRANRGTDDNPRGLRDVMHVGLGVFFQGLRSEHRRRRSHGAGQERHSSE